LNYKFQIIGTIACCPALRQKTIKPDFSFRDTEIRSRDLRSWQRFFDDSRETYRSRAIKDQLALDRLGLQSQSGQEQEEESPSKGETLSRNLKRQKL